MRLSKLAAVFAVALIPVTLACGAKPRPSIAHDQGTQEASAKPPTTMVAARRTAVAPKPLSETVKKGLAWLAAHQLGNGGWGQGDQAANTNDPSVNVADTAMALLAFLRAGHTARTGEYQNTVHRGLAYVMSEIEASDADSMYVTQVRNTRVQAKIGAYADTFAALMVLTEARGVMRDGVANARLDAALKKVVSKLERNQKSNGTWDDRGWAPVLTQALAAKGVNRAQQFGVDVAPSVLTRIEAYGKTGEMEAPRTSAGVEIYGSSAKNATLRDIAQSKRAKAAKMKAPKKPAREAQAPDAPTKAEIIAAEAEAASADAAARASEGQMLARLDDSQFIAGFGNNGGEEFLSYLLISETLVQRGGKDWQRWDQQISQLVGKVQNDDGSWTGHHCITGRTFCTAVALLVMMGDRTPAVAELAS